MANKKTLFCDAHGSCPSIQSKLKPIFTMPNLIDSLCLRVAQVPRSRDMAIFVLTTTTTALTIRPIILPLAHARGVIV